MDIQTLKQHIDGIDIYLLDQILKERYQPGVKILDVGCGNGRNLKWFYHSGYEIYGTDVNSACIEQCKMLYSKQKEHFSVASLEQMSYESNSFDHLICNAVLHFAKDLSQLLQMFEELLRILKPQGTLFIRIASNFGTENQVAFIDNGIYKLMDGTTRFLLTSAVLKELQTKYAISLLEDVKTTVVQNKRSMTTLVFKKEG